MKELIMIIRPEKLEIVKSILDDVNCGGMMISTIMGCGTQKGITEENSVNVIKGMKTNINLLPKVRVEVVVPDKIVENIITEIRDKWQQAESVMVKFLSVILRMRFGFAQENVAKKHYKQRGGLYGTESTK